MSLKLLKMNVPKVSFPSDAIEQGSSDHSLEVQSAAEFSSNPDQTHLPMIL